VRGPRALIAGLAVTETVSWGILYYAFPVLLPRMERDLGWSRATLVGAFTLAVITSGLAAIPVGHLLDRRSARALMAAGSAIGTVGAFAWAGSRSIVAFYGSWLLIGVAMALVLYEPAQVVLVKSFGATATKAITTLTLVAGFASTIFQPLTASLSDAFGWRAAIVILAVGLGMITIPIHLTVLPRRQRSPAAWQRAQLDTMSQPRSLNSTLGWLTVAFTLSWAAMAAAVVHLIPYLVDRGWTNFHAAIAAGVLGAMQVVARVGFRSFAERVSAARLAFGVLTVPVIGIVVLTISDGSAVAWVAVVLLGAGQGTASLLRPLVLSRRLSPSAYGRGAASSAAWSTVARAVAPLALAGAAGAGTNGYAIGLWMCVALGLAGAMIAHRALIERASVGAAVVG
jgi:predicted MFS family arabinose efflux permease